MFSEATKRFIMAHRSDNVLQLALKSKSIVGSDIDVSAAITQISGWQAIEHKIPSWYAHPDIIYPSHLPIEQCSSEVTATYKSSLVKGESFVDLTGGLGVDCAFISKSFQSGVYVERQQELCAIAGHNFSVLGLNHIAVVNKDALESIDKISNVDFIYLDPARRSNSGKKTVAMADCEPDISILESRLLEKAPTVMVKLSPMLDISLALETLKSAKQVHVVSVNGECKELLFILSNAEVQEPEIICLNILKNKETQLLSFCKSTEKSAIVHYASEILDFIYEPNASILKAGAYKLVSEKYQLQKLHPDSHLYTSRYEIPDFPGRIFKVESVFSLNKKEQKEHLAGVKQANISVRNFPVSVEDLRKRLGLKDGGDVYLFATTLNEKRILIKAKKTTFPDALK